MLKPQWLPTRTGKRCWNEGLQAIHDFAVNKVGKEDMKEMTRGWAHSQKALKVLAADYAPTRHGTRPCDGCSGPSSRHRSDEGFGF
jgi:hypothetical protein